MKTLINRTNPAIRITAPKIIETSLYYVLDFANDDNACETDLFKDDWTLVEEEPKHTEVWVEGRTIFEQDAKKPEIDLEKEVERFCLEYDSRKEVWFDMTPRDKKMLSIPTWSNFAADIAHHFYELGRKGNKELNNKSNSSNDSDMGSPWRNYIIEEL